MWEGRDGKELFGNGDRRERERRLYSLGFKCERALDPIFKFHDPNRRRLGKIKCVNFRKGERERESKKRKEITEVMIGKKDEK